MLDFENIKIQRDKLLFEIDSLRLKRGTFYGIAGKNGVGKSTWLHLFFDPKTPNGISWKGTALTNLSRKIKAQNFSLLDNKALGFTRLTVYEYVSLGRQPYTGFYGKLNNTDHEIIDNALKLFEMTELAQKSIFELSDGERQRASLARVESQQCELILLDEPTAFLDYPSKRVLFEWAQNKTKNEGKIVLMATHDLELAHQFCDNWLIITKNKKLELIEHCSFEELIKKGFQ